MRCGSCTSRASRSLRRVRPRTGPSLRRRGSAQLSSSACYPRGLAEAPQVWWRVVISTRNWSHARMSRKYSDEMLGLSVTPEN